MNEDKHSGSLVSVIIPLSIYIIIRNYVLWFEQAPDTLGKKIKKKIAKRICDTLQINVPPNLEHEYTYFHPHVCDDQIRFKRELVVDGIVRDETLITIQPPKSATGAKLKINKKMDVAVD